MTSSDVKVIFICLGSGMASSQAQRTALLELFYFFLVDIFSSICRELVSAVDRLEIIRRRFASSVDCEMNCCRCGCCCGCYGLSD